MSPLHYSLAPLTESLDTLSHSPSLISPPSNHKRPATRMPCGDRKEAAYLKPFNDRPPSAASPPSADGKGSSLWGLDPSGHPPSKDRLRRGALRLSCSLIRQTLTQERWRSVAAPGHPGSHLRRETLQREGYHLAGKDPLSADRRRTFGHRPAG